MTCYGVDHRSSDQGRWGGLKSAVTTAGMANVGRGYLNDRVSLTVALLQQVLSYKWLSRVGSTNVSFII